jgi:hypothetical protein
MTRLEKLAYLRGEHARLVEQFRTLRSEFEALQRARAPRHGCAAYSQRLREYAQQLREHRSLHANHRIALEWTRYPPCGRTSVPSPLRHIPIPFSASSRPPCAFAVAHEEEAADLAAV